MNVAEVCAIIAAVLGTVITSMLRRPPQKKTCTRCGMTIPGKATKCPYCLSRQPESSIGLFAWIVIVGGLYIVLAMICILLGLIS